MIEHYDFADIGRKHGAGSNVGNTKSQSPVANPVNAADIRDRQSCGACALNEDQTRRMQTTITTVISTTASFRSGCRISSNIAAQKRRAEGGQDGTQM